MIEFFGVYTDVIGIVLIGVHISNQCFNVYGYNGV